MDDFNPMQIAAVIVVLIGVMVAALVGTAVIDGVSSSAQSNSQPVMKSASPLVTTGEASSFHDTSSYFSGEVAAVLQVKDSTGEAIKLRGAGDSTYRSSSPIAFASDSTWTVSVFASWNNSFGTTNGTVYSLNGRLILQYNNATQQWVGWYYDEGDRDSYRVNVSATAQPGGLQNIQLVGNGTHFAIYRNNTRGEVADLSAESSEDPLVNASNWAGRQEELRGYDDNFSASARQALIDSPILPVNGHERTFRVMFDGTGDGSEPVYFTDASLSLSNTSVASGVAGNVLSAGTDYSVDLGSATITALSGGKLDGAPTAFVEYRFLPNKAVSSLTNDIAGSMELFAVVPLVMVAGMLFFVLYQFSE